MIENLHCSHNPFMMVSSSSDRESSAPPCKDDMQQRGVVFIGQTVYCNFGIIANVLHMCTVVAINADKATVQCVGFPANKKTVAFDELYTSVNNGVHAKRAPLPHYSAALKERARALARRERALHWTIAKHNSATKADRDTQRKNVCDAHRQCVEFVLNAHALATRYRRIADAYKRQVQPRQMAKTLRCKHVI